MKKLNKAIAVLLTLLVLISAAPLGMLSVSALSVEAGGSYIGGNWILYSNGELAVSGSGEMYSSPWNTDDLKTKIRSVRIYDGVTRIYHSAFSGCTELTAVSIPGSVAEIDYSAFSGCTKLKNISLSGSVKSVASSAFRNTGYYNDSANWENDVLYLGDWLLAVKTWKDFDNLVIRSGTKNIAEDAFSSCGGIKRVTLPESITGINSSAFQECTGLTDITIPDSVTSIGSYAFSGCTGLKDVTIPDSVTSIGYSAFQDCIGLTGITIPDSVTRIGGSAFSGCTGLTGITIPDSVTRIGSFTFSGCTGLKDVTISDSVTSIDDYAFKNCAGLADITIPGSVTSLSPTAFVGCSGIKSVKVDKSNSKYHSDGNCIIETETRVLISGFNCSIIPSDGSVTVIGNSAFSGCTGLTNIKIPDSVTSIDSYAFSGCTGLTGITIPDSVTSIGRSAFSGCTGLTSITIPDSVTSIGNSAFSGCTGLTSIIIPDSVTSIGDSAFEICKRLTNITMSNSVTSIGRSAFSGCTGLTSITIPDSVTSISSYAFSGCTGLTGIIIPDSVTSIGDSAFSGCTGLTSITLPDSVTNIDYHAFYGCTGLTDITIPNSVTSIDDSAFSDTGYYNNSSNWENGVLYIGNCLMKAKNGELSSNYNVKPATRVIADCAFQYCTKLTGISMPNSVTNIGNCAFYGCTGLTGITIPDSVTSIGDYAFYGCTGFTGITIPNRVTSIGDSAFSGCTGLTNITISDSVTSIGNSAFSGCTGLTGITIPDSIKIIERGAFSGCTGISSITLPDKAIEIQAFVFSNTGYFNNSSNWNNNFLFIGNHLINAKEDISGRVVIKNGTLDIAGSAFRGSGITSVYIPDSLKIIEEFAFRDCKDLSEIRIPDGITHFGAQVFIGTAFYNNPDNSQDGVLYYNNYALMADKDTSECIIKNGTTVISDYFATMLTNNVAIGYSGNYNITSVTIPDSVTSIGKNAFMSCVNLKYISGYPGSAAESYAKENNIAFKSIKPAAATVTFVSNGEIIESRTVDIGAKLGELPSASAEPGKTLVGWTDSEGKTVSSDTVVTGDMTFTANWAECKVKDFSFAFSENVYTGVPLSEFGSGITVTYDNGDTAKLTSGYTVSPSEFSSAGQKNVTVSFGGSSKTFSVKVFRSMIVEMSLLNVPEKAVYKVNEVPDFSAIRISATYNSGRTAVLTPTSFEYDFSSAGTKTVEVTVSDNGLTFSETFDVIVENPVRISADNISGNAGDTVTVPVRINDNSGIMGFGFDIVYDSAQLKPISVSAGEDYGNDCFVDDIETADPGSFAVHWCGTDDITANGEIFAVTFEILEDAAPETTVISIKPIEDEVFNSLWETVDIEGLTADIAVSNELNTIKLIKNTVLSIKNGMLVGLKAISNKVSDILAMFRNKNLIIVDSNGKKLDENSTVGTDSSIKLEIDGKEVDSVSVVVKGDMTGDGKANNRDVAMLMRYLAEKEIPSNCKIAAVDINEDGVVDNRDAAMLAQVLVGKYVL